MDRKRQKLTPGKNDAQKECQEAETATLKQNLVDMEAKLMRVNESNEDALGINSLHDEIILEIFGYLEQNQLGQIARVCRKWNVLTKIPVLWRNVKVEIFSPERKKNTVVQSFINGLPSCVTAIRLDFSDYRNWNEPFEFEELCVKLQQNCLRLEKLILTNLKILNKIPNIIKLSTQFLQCVKNLVFHHCYFYDYYSTIEFDGTSKIEVLDLSYCRISEYSKTQFSKYLYLKELHLAGTNVDDTNNKCRCMQYKCRWFADDTSLLNQLQVLDLGWTSISFSTFLAIQRHGHNLKELYLCSVYLRDSDLNFNNSTILHLKTICLAKTRVTCEGVVSLIQSCPSLENVYVDEDVAESFSAHPIIVANRCQSGTVKAIGWDHNHNANYLYN